MWKQSLLPCQMDMGFLHDSQPGKQRLQVILTGQVVIQGLGMSNGLLSLIANFEVKQINYGVRRELGQEPLLLFVEEAS